MSSGRLTKHDRQQIAFGLADDLPYAEIARRIERPTSTVTREVMRNGGPHSYRADLAQHAAERRSRRGAAQQRTSGRSAGERSQALADYEDAFTTLLMQSGLPRVAAGVLMSLYIADAESLTAAELVQRLGVSPGSISKAIALLESQGLITREREGGRRERYIADGDVWYQSVIAAAQSNRQLAEAAREGVRLLGRDSAAGERLEHMARFASFVGDSLESAAEKARELL
jgi:DNA-binding transcriptional regulator GbsR (MarR family)